MYQFNEWELIKIHQFNEWICKIFGHKYNDIDILVFQIMDSAINRNELTPPILKCRRCGATIATRF